MAGKPAVTLLHLAPGFANAAANLHNARKARVPMVNLVGDHALRHQKYDAPCRRMSKAPVRPSAIGYVRVVTRAALPPMR
nr:thiamine pyrophosphate-binding protein [Sulfitobacter faviae]